MASNRLSQLWLIIGLATAAVGNSETTTAQTMEIGYWKSMQTNSANETYTALEGRKQYTIVDTDPDGRSIYVDAMTQEKFVFFKPGEYTAACIQYCQNHAIKAVTVGYILVHTTDLAALSQAVGYPVKNTDVHPDWYVQVITSGNTVESKARLAGLPGVQSTKFMPCSD